MLERLPGGVGVLCTTATANDRVVADIEEQLRTGHTDTPLVAYRGPLGRSSLRLEVVELPGQADRLAWLATWLGELPGSGIVYTLTKRDAEQVAAWLCGRGIAAEAYTGEIDTERRIGVEDRLLRNDLKCVVATSALGMGYDKPDLGFVVHYQAPGSVISYYQQVGRAGRAIENAEVVLLRGREDRRIQDFFIEQAFPRREVVDTVLSYLDDAGVEGATTPELTAQVNLGRGRVEAMLKVLDVEGAVSRSGTRWVRAAGDWEYDADRYAKVTELRRREQATMASFGADGRCLMRALQEELDDPDPQDCGRCSVCAGPRYDAQPDGALVRAALEHLRSRPLTLEVKKMSPDADGKLRKIGADVLVQEGRALARIGDGGWDPLVRAGRRSGRFDDELVEADGPARARLGAARLVGRGDPVAALGRSRAGPRTPPRRRARPRLRRGDRARRRSPAAARDGELRAAGLKRPRRVRDHRRAAARRVPARRRPALQRLDAGDGRRPATPPRQRRGVPAGARHRVLSEVRVALVPLCGTTRHPRPDAAGARAPATVRGMAITPPATPPPSSPSPAARRRSTSSTSTDCATPRSRRSPTIPAA